METTKPIQDFGAKIGGARKDLRGNFTVNDLGALTAVERVSLVRKDMVWPTPDYVGMVKEGGYTREAAAMVKMLRDAFPPAPIVKEGTNEAGFTNACALYIKTLNVAKRICSAGKSSAELATAMREDAETANLLLGIQITNTGWSITNSPRLLEWRAGPMSAMALSWRQFSDMTDSLHHFAVGSLDRTMARLLRKNSAWPEGTSLAEAWTKRMGLSVKPHGQAYRIAVCGRELDELEWRFLGKPAGFSEIIGKQFATSAEAELALKTAVEGRFAAKRAEAKQKQQELIARAKGTSIKVEGEGYRQGTEWRKAPAVTDHYLNHFKLRGGEFGLWVNQTERQQVLDRGYDALRDLSEMFGWPSESISLGGTLAIAFGARGRGGKTPAAAHYEPGRKVINLTKPHGEGCLAHEWAHALDHYLGERAMRLGLIRPSGAAPFLSGSVLNSHAEQRLDSDEAKFILKMRSAMELVQRRPQLKEEALESTTKAFAVALERFDQHWMRLRRNYEQDAVSTSLSKETLDAALTKHEEIRQFYLTSRVDYPKGDYRVGKGSEVYFGNTSLSLIAGGHWAEAITYHTSRLDCIQQQHRWTESQWRPRTVDSNYRKACLELDRSAKKAYYALPHEMFARAFETAVADYLEKTGRSNPYLVSGANGLAYPSDHERFAFSLMAEDTLKKFPEYVPSIGLSELTERRVTNHKLEQAEIPHIGAATTIQQAI